MTRDSARRDGAFRPVRQGVTSLPARARRPRLESSSYQGMHAFHVIVRTKQPSAAFDNTTGHSIIETLHEVARLMHFDLLAYCLMPDHMHILCQGQSAEANLQTFMHRFKQLSSFSYKKTTGHPLWQTSFFDRAVRQEESLQVVADYILHNLVTEGLVAAPEHYDLSGGIYSPNSHADGPEGAVPTSISVQPTRSLEP